MTLPEILITLFFLFTSTVGMCYTVYWFVDVRVKKQTAKRKRARDEFDINVMGVIDSHYNSRFSLVYEDHQRILKIEDRLDKLESDEL